MDYSNVKKQKTVLYGALQVLGIFAILIIGNGFDWVNMKFSISKLTTWDYWNGVIQQVLMYSIALVIGYIGRLQKEELTNEEYAIQMNLYHTYWMQITESFNHFCENILNPRIRKQYFIKSIKHKLYLLEKKHNKHDSYKLEYNRALDWYIVHKETNFWEYKLTDYIEDKQKKECKKYILKRFEFESLINEANVDKACLTFEDYPRVNPHSFTWSIRVKDKGSNEYKTESSLGKDLVLKFIQKALSVVLVAILIGTIGADPSKNELLEQVDGTIKLLIKYSIRVGSVFASWLSGVYFGKNMFESNYLDVVNNRNRICAEYINYKANIKEEETEAYKIKLASIQVDKPKEQKEEISEEEKNAIVQQELEKRKAQEFINSLNN